MSHVGAEEYQPALLSARRAAALDKTNFMVPYLHAALALNEKQFGEAEGAATQMLEIVPVLVPASCCEESHAWACVTVRPLGRTSTPRSS